MSDKVYYPVSIITYAFVVLAACTVDIEVIFGFVGATAVSMIVYILPSGFYIRSVKLEGEQVSSCMMISVWLFLIFGIINFVGLNFVVVYSMVNKL
jgi:hypothetical protein